MAKIRAVRHDLVHTINDIFILEKTLRDMEIAKYILVDGQVTSLEDYRRHKEAENEANGQLKFKKSAVESYNRALSALEKEAMAIETELHGRGRILEFKKRNSY